MSKSAREITQDAFHRVPMIHCRSMHELREAVYRVGDIRTSKGEILKASDDTYVLSRIRHWRARVQGELGRRRKRGRNRLSMKHICLV